LQGLFHLSHSTSPHHSGSWNRTLTVRACYCFLPVSLTAPAL
jgi:hypothetical protein